MLLPGTARVLKAAPDGRELHLHDVTPGRVAGPAAEPHSPHAQALADDLGSLREIVSRVLKNFANQGWVMLGRELIEVHDADAPRRLCGA
ncbi:MAG: winged helix-turn-helix domain-containing protein [Paucibacter sp.]|nr:winged helix-turn-helix domain-containing protein [Roseateles sp.]